jgi:SAM-dependent methyltransferase
MCRIDPANPGRPGVVDWPLWECSGCGSLHVVEGDRACATRLEVASYTDPMNEAEFLERRREYFRWIVELVDDAPGRHGHRRVLDFGCSYGHLLVEFAARGWEPVGIDSTARALDVARTNLPEARLCATLDEMKGMGLVHAAMAIDVLYFLDRPDDVLRQIRELLVPDGRIAIRVTNRAWLYQVLRWSGQMRRSGLIMMGSSHWAFTRRGVVSLLERSGFKDIRFEESERGKGSPDLTRRAYYLVSEGLASLTGGRLAVQGGIFAVARRA